MGERDGQAFHTYWQPSESSSGSARGPLDPQAAALSTSGKTVVTTGRDAGAWASEEETAMAHTAQALGAPVSRPARGASSREIALRFNRSVIGLGLVALLIILLLPN